ncbi:hypothetical protein ACFQV2_04955 [Actinokineospora soli]|uniref:Uncharacterized protein n=1 Tax=Actinokineospora soli TaxID=1048753 RepID=A0ABW2TKG3_9PSEU
MHDVLGQVRAQGVDEGVVVGALAGADGVAVAGAREGLPARTRTASRPPARASTRGPSPSSRTRPSGPRAAVAAACFQTGTANQSARGRGPRGLAVVSSGSASTQ